MTFVGIDQSLSAFAAAAYGDLYPEGAFLLISSPQKGVRRLMEIREGFKWWLDRLAGPVGMICMEGYANGARFAREAMGEAGAVTRLTLFEHFGGDDPLAFPTEVQPMQLKKFVGNTAAKKDDIKLLCYKKWGVEIQDHNLADAFVLSRIAESLYTGLTNHDYEAQVIAKVRGHNEWEMKLTPRRGAKKTSSV